MGSLSDFSQYSTESPEWLETKQGLPPMPVPDPEVVLPHKAAVKAAFAAGGREMMAAVAHLVETSEHEIPTRDGSVIEARVYRPAAAPTGKPLPVYLFAQGSGWLFGSLDSGDGWCARLAAATGIMVLSVDYRHTPEFVYPTQWLDLEDAFGWLHDNIATLNADPERVIVGGVSAGATLLASLVLGQHLGEIAADRPRIFGQLLAWPILVHPDCYGPLRRRLKDPDRGSYAMHANSPTVSMASLRLIIGLLKITGTPAEDDRMLNPANVPHEKLTGMPPTAVMACGADMFRDEALLYAEALHSQGVPVHGTIFSGFPHGLVTMTGDKLKGWEKWYDAHAKAVKWMLDGATRTEKLGFNNPYQD